ncbi:hypothetical protein [Erythrobacter rubeus]|uniref:Uncharacterized protein n=1 Tax=Erythrobacter rubeus TaxID=2760803 RepID=A0ABR8KLZ6_9SPHN|nr:hypothetical protein [Erythrobacter rubeus]MBD2841508.1 hypothetical protein [Erythrobacter rubeus]
MELPAVPLDDAIDLATVSDRLNNPEVAAYFRGNAHRLASVRAIISLLDLPAPDWSRRSLSGRASVHKAAIDRWKADNPDEAASR